MKQESKKLLHNWNLVRQYRVFRYVTLAISAAIPLLVLGRVWWQTLLLFLFAVLVPVAGQVLVFFLWVFSFILSFRNLDSWLMTAYYIAFGVYLLSLILPALMDVARIKR